MKLKVSIVELRRLAALAGDSVVQGHREDIRLRDYLVNILRDHTERRLIIDQKKRAIKENAALLFRATFQRAGRKGV